MRDMLPSLPQTAEDPDSQYALPVDKDRYWMWAGHNSLHNADPDSFDLSNVLDTEQNWERLGIPLTCSICDEVSPGLFKVRSSAAEGLIRMAASRQAMYPL
jgi:hypothetical protein